MAPASTSWPRSRAARATVLLPTDRFDVEEAWRLIEQHRVTNMFTVPTILKMLVEHPAVDRYDHSSLRHVIYAGAPMYRDDQKRALQQAGPGASCSISAWARSPATSPCCRAALHERRGRPGLPLGSCGCARTGHGNRHPRRGGRELAPGETGEICVRGPAVFAGYYDNPEANAKAFRGGWFHTGDLGHLDAEGFLYITGRASDMYISGGSNVYPREVEEAILHPSRRAEVRRARRARSALGRKSASPCWCRAPASRYRSRLLARLDGRVAATSCRGAWWLGRPAESGYGKITKKMVREEMEARGILPLGGA